MSNHNLLDKIDEALPQSQCQACQHNGCRPYAEAIANDKDTIDKCAPGGIKTLIKLAQLTKQSADPFRKQVEANTRPPMVAKIREAECIGCTKCIQACPVDAIVGSGKLMHSVITQECTGCELCVAPCPVDCIDMHSIDKMQYSPTLAKMRYQQHNQRLATTKTIKKQDDSIREKQQFILEAVKRAKAKKNKYAEK